MLYNLLFYNCNWYIISSITIAIDSFPPCCEKWQFFRRSTGALYKIGPPKAGGGVDLEGSRRENDGKILGMGAP